MKTKLTALALLTVTALSFTPKPAQANDEGLAILGGIIGGVIIASALSDCHHDACPPTPNSAIIVSDRNDRCNDGCWRVVAVRVWVPGCWIEERGNYGRSHRRYVSGHYENRNNRVWVANDHHVRNDRQERHGRELSYGYGNNR